jgi:Putative Flp pilus-assembly TadE/G-like
MERSNRFAARRTSRFPGSPATRQGKFTLVILIAIIGMMVIIGFVGNVGYVVTEKMNSQNAADAVAFSSAQWMARGMNAVTATNHLLGEVTGLVVVMEGLGGPEADQQMVAYPLQASIPDDVNRSLADLAFVQGNSIYGTDAVGKIDKPFVKAIVKDLVSKKDKKHKAFATIYDSKVVLKRAVTPRLIAKFLANWLFLVPPPWGYLAAAGAYITHGVADEQLFKIGVEYVILEGLEQLVTRGQVLKKLKVDLLENKLIPALAAHGDLLAGRPSKEAKQNPNTESAVVNHAIRDSLSHLGEVYHVKAAIYPTALTIAPTALASAKFANLRLPIEPEAPPTGKGTPKGKEEKEWGNDKLQVEDSDNQLDKVLDDIKDKKKKINDRIKLLEKQVETLQGLKTEVADLRGRTGVTPQELAAFDDESKKIDADIAKLQQRIAKLKQDLKDLEAQEKKMRETIASLQSAPIDTSGNLSAERAHLALDKMNTAEERYTQWVRATNPYMDAFRAPILRLFKHYLSRSGAADHYEKWTNRYTLVKSWQFRSGYRFERVSDTKGQWKKKSDVEPLQMYLMAQTFDPMKPSPPPKAGAVRVRKGEEVWTKESADGKKMAEEMFTIVAMTHREIKPFFSPIIFPVASRNGMTTFAQAIYYNSNPEQPAPKEKSLIQPKVGWDTLNWAPDSSPPEWGAPATVAADEKWPWDLFTEESAFVGQSHAKLNWQAMLMPVTKSRFEQAIPASATAVEPEMTLNLTFALPLFDKMVTH